MAKVGTRLPSIPIAVRVVGSLLMLVALGTALLLSPAASADGRGLAFNEAAFTAVSALSVTGLSILTPSTDLSRFGQVLVMLLIQIGGIGYMVFAVTIFQLLGRSLSLTDRMALQDSLGVVNLGGIALLAKQVLLAVLTIEMLVAGALYLHWSRFLPQDDLAFMALFHAVSSFCNAGFELFSANPGFPAGFPTDAGTLAIIGTAIVLGGLGIPVLYELLTFRTRKRMSVHTRLTIWTVGILIAWGALGLFLSESRPGNVLAGLPLWEQVKYSVFQSISCRTAGFVGMPRFESLDAASQLMILTLMFVGCAPASMGGGVTTGTLIVMVLALGAYLRGHSTPIVAGRAIPGLMVRKAAAVLTLSLFVVLTVSWLLMLTHPVSLEKAIFETVSAFATCGLSLGFTGELNGIGQLLICIVMLWGRLGALTLLVVLTRTGAQRRVHYPEEKILIG